MRERLERAGQRVIGVDLRDAEVIADLGSPAGRAAATDGVLRAAGNELDGVVACAGLGPEHRDTAAIVSVNYFGAVAFLDGFRGALGAGREPAAVAVSSNSATLSPSDGRPPRVSRGRRIGSATARHGGDRAYAASRLARARRAARAAIAASAGAGIRLNAVAPGATPAPLLQHDLITRGSGGHPRISIPLAFGSRTGSRRRPLPSSAPTAFCCGRYAVDGSSDALLRWAPWDRNLVACRRVADVGSSPLQPRPAPAPAARGEPQSWMSTAVRSSASAAAFTTTTFR